MADAAAKVRLSAPLERVWEVVTDLTRWDWRRDLSRIEVSGESGFIEVDRDGRETNFTITGWEPLALWEFSMENPNLTGYCRVVFERDGEGTLLTLSESVSAKKLLMRPMVKGYLQKHQADYLENLRNAL